MPIPAAKFADKTMGLANGINGSMKKKRSSNNLKKLFTNAFRSTGVKSIFKSKPKPKPPAEVVRRVRCLLEAVDSLHNNVDVDPKQVINNYFLSLVGFKPRELMFSIHFIDHSTTIYEIG